MQIIKLNATDSTNVYLRELNAKKPVEDYTVVVTKTQKKGKGQMGASWQSESGKNLTFSVFKKIEHIKIEDQFYISMVTSLALVDVLNVYNIPKIKIKWPNDILSEEQKICGILIETIVKRKKFDGAIIGIGLNVNQTQFKNLPRASSLKIITGRLFDLDEVMQAILKRIEYYFKLIAKGQFERIAKTYTKLMFRLNKPSTFRDSKGEMFSAFVKGIDDKGNLKLLLEDEVMQYFSLKEVELLY